MNNAILSELLIDLSEIIDNGEVVSIDEIKMQITNKNIIQFLMKKFSNKYHSLMFKEFRIDELNTIIYDACDTHNINKLPVYNNDLNFLMGIIAQAIQ
jgi:hypothetical protein